MSAELLEKTKHLLEIGWVWKSVDGFGKILTSPSNDIYPLKKINDQLYIPEFIK
jgi:hypothetical protein